MDDAARRDQVPVCVEVLNLADRSVVTCIIAERDRVGPVRQRSKRSSAGVPVEVEAVVVLPSAGCTPNSFAGTAQRGVGGFIDSAVVMVSLQRMNGPDDRARIAVRYSYADVPNAFQCVLLRLQALQRGPKADGEHCADSEHIGLHFDLLFDATWGSKPEGRHVPDRF